jgi:hypothetical protein
MFQFFLHLKVKLVIPGFQTPLFRYGGMTAQFSSLVFGRADFLEERKNFEFALFKLGLSAQEGVRNNIFL